MFGSHSLGEANLKRNTSVVIACAGLGSRIGAEIPKSLLHIAGKTLIERQLTLITEFYDHVIVVAGYQKKQLIEEIVPFAEKVTIVMNNDYRTSGTALSLGKAVPFCREYTLFMDGDVLISKSSLLEVAQTNFDFIGLSLSSSKFPVSAMVNSNLLCTQLMHGETNQKFEWNGFLRIRTRLLTHLGNGHLYPRINSLLPLPGLVLETIEIDYPEDINRAEEWIKNFKDE